MLSTFEGEKGFDGVHALAVRWPSRWPVRIADCWSSGLIKPTLAVQPRRWVLPLPILRLVADVAMKPGNQLIEAGELSSRLERLLGSAALNLVRVSGIPVLEFRVGFARAHFGCVSILFLYLFSVSSILGRNIAVT
jgi:hypothetical protein